VKPREQGLLGEIKDASHPGCCSTPPTSDIAGENRLAKDSNLLDAILR
jgi:hypothetical protein